MMTIRAAHKFAAAALLLLAALATPSAAIAATAPQWEQISVQPRADGNVDSDVDEGDGKVSVNVRDGYIYISTTAEVNIKVFTILGQPVARKTVPPGMVRLRLPSRGVYILKAGTYTRRLNL